MQQSWARPPDFESLLHYGWSWCAEATVDENFLDLAFLVARNSTCKDGHMGCVIVSGVPRASDQVHSDVQVGTVTLCTINSSLFGAYRSDCHAEANAVAECAARGLVLRGLSVYVTRSPCTACYKLLASAGVRRIIAPQPLASADCIASAAALEIECVAVRDTEARAARRESLGASHEDRGRIQALWEERKRLRAEKSFGKKAIRQCVELSAVRSDPTPPCASRDGQERPSDQQHDNSSMPQDQD